MCDSCGCHPSNLNVLSMNCHRTPSHPLLTSFVSHMGLGGRANWEAPLNSVPRVPNHSSCEMGELTQTGERRQSLQGSGHAS